MKRFFLLLISIPVFCANLVAQDTGESPRTTINSDRLEMQGTVTHNYFYFGGNVHVQGNDLEIRCDELTVRAGRAGDEESNASSTVGELGAVEEIVAVGNVEIVQAGRIATAGRVVVNPLEGTIHFLENPVIVQGDMRAEAYGYIFYTAEKRFEAMNPPGFVPGAPGRSTISLSNLPEITVNVPTDSISLGTETEEAIDEAAEEGVPEDSERPNAGGAQ